VTLRRTRYTATAPVLRQNYAAPHRVAYPQCHGRALQRRLMPVLNPHPQAAAILHTGTYTATRVCTVPPAHLHPPRLTLFWTYRQRCSCYAHSCSLLTFLPLMPFCRDDAIPSTCYHPSHATVRRNGGTTLPAGTCCAIMVCPRHCHACRAAAALRRCSDALVRLPTTPFPATAAACRTTRRTLVEFLRLRCARKKKSCVLWMDCFSISPFGHLTGTVDIWRRLKDGLLAANTCPTGRVCHSLHGAPPRNYYTVVRAFCRWRRHAAVRILNCLSFSSCVAHSWTSTMPPGLNRRPPPFLPLPACHHRHLPPLCTTYLLPHASVPPFFTLPSSGGLPAAACRTPHHQGATYLLVEGPSPLEGLTPPHTTRKRLPGTGTAAHLCPGGAYILCACYSDRLHSNTPLPCHAFFSVLHFFPAYLYVPFCSFLCTAAHCCTPVAFHYHACTGRGLEDYTRSGTVPPPHVTTPHPSFTAGPFMYPIR